MKDSSFSKRGTPAPRGKRHNRLLEKRIVRDPPSDTKPLLRSRTPELFQEIGFMEESLGTIADLPGSEALVRLVRDVEPLTAAERWTDAFGSFDEAIRAIGVRYRAGEDINRGYFKRTK